MRNTTKAWTDAILYLIAFIVIQAATMFVVSFVAKIAIGVPLEKAWKLTSAVDEQGKSSILILSSALGAMLVIGVFVAQVGSILARIYPYEALERNLLGCLSRPWNHTSFRMDHGEIGTDLSRTSPRRVRV